MNLLKLPRRDVLRLLGLSAGTLALGSRPAFAANPRVGLQLSWLPSVQFAGSYLAADQGFWKREGLDVTLSSGGPNAPVEPPVVVGQALMGISAADYAAAAVAEGAPFKIVAVAMQKNPFAIASLAPKPVKTPKDLVGKRIGMATANTPVLQALCTLNQIDLKKITVVPTQYDAAPLVNGEVDCLLCWLTDLPIALKRKGIDPVTLLLADYGYTVHSQAYIVLEDSLKSKRAEVVKLLKGELKGWQVYQKNTDAAAKLTLKLFPDAGLDLPTQQLRAREQLQLMFSPLTDQHGFGWFTDESVAANIRTLKLLGQSATPDLWDRSVLEEIYQNGPKL